MADDIQVRVGLDASGFAAGVQQMNRSIDATRINIGRMVSDVSNQISRVSSVFTRLDLTQIGLTQGHERVRQAQERLTLATQEGGAATVEAIKARRDLEAAERDLEKTQLRARLSTALIVGDIASMAASIPNTVRALAALRTAQLATAGSASAMNIAMTGGIAAIGIAAGLAVVAATMGKVDSGSSAAADSVAELETQLKSLVAERNRLANEPEPATHGNYLNVDFDLTGDKLRGLDEQIRTTTETLNVFRDQAAKEAGEAAKKVAEEAERAWLQANVSLQNSLVSGLGQVGASLQKLSTDAQRGILIGGGIDPKFVESLMAAQLGEDRLTASALKSSKALRDQTTITARKDEVTADFQKRLLELGFTEAEVAARIDDTGRALRSQTQATQEASAATSSFGGGAVNGNPVGSRSGGANGWEYSNQAGGQQDYMGLTGFILQNQQKVIDGFLGRKNAKAPPMDVDGVASALMGGSNGIGVPGVGFWVGDVGDDRRKKMVGTLKNLIVKETPSTVWDSLLGQLGVNQFAHGVEGVIRKPGLFMAGEYGAAESIKISPLSSGQKSGGEGGVHIGTIVVNANDRKGGEEAADALSRRLRRLGVFG